MHIDVARIVTVPFAARPVNPATPQTREPTINWLRGLGPLTTRTAVDQYDAMGWFFIFDDRFDGPLGSDPAAVGRITDVMAAAWRARARENWIRYLRSYRWEAESRQQTAAVHRYVDSMRDWMHANLAWSLETARYTAACADRAGSGGQWRDLLVASPLR
jgi:hypothetical protein